MVTVDNQFIDELGLEAVPQDEKDRMIADITESLADRIGARAEEELGDDKAEELDGIIGSANGDQAVIDNWLASNLPDYQQIVDEEVTKIKEEIRSQAQDILAQLNAPVD